MITICFEGVDGAGKTTQAGKLEKHLMKQGYRVKRVKFPTWYVIKEILKGGHKIDDKAFHLLCAADFYNFQATELEHIKANYDYLILDRFWYSNIIYGVTKDIPISFLANIHQGLIKPDIVILLDIDLDTLLYRKKQDPDIRGFNVDILDNLIVNYRNLPSIVRDFISKTTPYFCFLDGRESEENIFNKIIKILNILNK